MYTLILEESERAAFDWVGNRYSSTGDDTARILRDCLEPDDEWTQIGPITFKIPEHKAWEIMTHAEEENNAWPCFSSKLAKKMQSFVDKIV